MSGLLISHLTNAYDVLRDLGARRREIERERECTQMAHNGRVITNILEAAVGGWIVGSLCVKSGFCEAEFKTSHLSKKIFFFLLKLIK